MGILVEWIQIKSYKRVKYRKPVEKWCTDVPKCTTPYGGARHSEHVFCRRHKAALVLNGLKGEDRG